MLTAFRISSIAVRTAEISRIQHFGTRHLCRVRKTCVARLYPSAGSKQSHSTIGAVALFLFGRDLNPKRSEQAKLAPEENAHCVSHFFHCCAYRRDKPYSAFWCEELATSTQNASSAVVSLHQAVQKATLKPLGCSLQLSAPFGA